MAKNTPPYRIKIATVFVTLILYQIIFTIIAAMNPKKYLVRKSSVKTGYLDWMLLRKNYPSSVHNRLTGHWSLCLHSNVCAKTVLPVASLCEKCTAVTDHEDQDRN